MSSDEEDDEINRRFDMATALYVTFAGYRNENS
jgi:hypothetical protein